MLLKQKLRQVLVFTLTEGIYWTKLELYFCKFQWYPTIFFLNIESLKHPNMYPSAALGFMLYIIKVLFMPIKWLVH